MSARHREDDVGGLRTHTGEGHQLLPRPFHRKGEDPFDLTAPGVTDRGCRRPDSRGLLTRKAGVPNRPSNLLFGRVRESFGGDSTDSAAQVYQAAAFVRRGRALREDRGDEDLEGRHSAGPVLDRITDLENPHRSEERSAVHGLATSAGGKRWFSF